MFSLILVVISIALISAVVAASMNYTPMEAYTRQNIVNEAEKGLDSLESGVIRYLDANRDVAGNIVYPGDGVDLVSAIAPLYTFIPGDVQGQLTWSVVTGPYIGGLPAVGICLQPVGVSTDVQVQAMEALQRRSPVGSTFINTACNSTGDSVSGDHLTRWVVVSQHN